MPPDVSRSLSSVLAHYAPLESHVDRLIHNSVFTRYVGQRSWWDGSDYERAAKSLSLTSEHALIDYGCGFGGPLRYISSLIGCRGFGYDINPNAVKLANERSSQGTCTFGTSLPSARCRFQAALMIDVCCHLPELTAALAELRDLCDKGARLVLTDPLVVEDVVLREDWKNRTPRVFYRASTDASNRDEIEAAGFKVLEAQDVTPDLTRLAERYVTAFYEHRKEYVKQYDEGEYDLVFRQLQAVLKCASGGSIRRYEYLGRAA